jgi:20S proteasome alpha/beta subunit
MKLGTGVWKLAAVMLLGLSQRALSQNPSDVAGSAAQHISRGTLVVAIASPRFIVVATDSRKTWLDGRPPQDNSKKLFRVGKTRVLAIAGLASVSIPEVPGLSEDIASEFDYWIDYSASPSSAAGMTDIDNRCWNDPPPPEYPPSWPEEGRRKLLDDMPHYVWWQMTEGPVEAIANIAATYHPGRPLEGYRLEGLLAGFKENGEAKLEYMLMIPSWDTTPWDLPRVGLGQAWVRLRTRDRLIHKTMGITRWADRVLDGEINDDLRLMAKGFPALETFIARRADGKEDQMSEAEAVALCKALIALTADQDTRVGREPVQIAIMRPKQEASADLPMFARPPNPLRFGTTRGGIIFTPDFPFGSEKDTTYAWSEIKNNQAPIPLDTNYFYGNKFDHATFVFRGGVVHFGTNNSVKDSTLVIEKGADESALAPSIVRQFQRVERPASKN